MNDYNTAVIRAVRTVIAYDKCKEIYTDLKRLLKANGWSFGKYIKCPDCKSSKKLKENKSNV
ncbi:MAG: hypothetical protein ACI4HK_02790 [Ruminococcus sp.]